MYRTSFRRAWLCSAHLGWALLLDVYVIISQVAMPSVLDRWMCADFHSSSCLITWSTDANTIGNIASVASVDWGCAVQIMAVASIGSGLRFSPTVSQTLYVQPFSCQQLCCIHLPSSAVYALLLCCHAAICSLTPAVIARLQIPYITMNVM